MPCITYNDSYMSLFKRVSLILFLLATLLPAPTNAVAQTNGDAPAVTTELAATYDRTIPEIMNNYGMYTIGVGVIKNGELAWEGYYGEQAPGVPASDQSLFNVASITKTITAEAILHMVEEGAFELDASMASHWVDPHLESDPRHKLLTPRMALNHSTGFPNWRYMDPEGILRFANDPGATFGYSGEGFEYVMQYAAKRLGSHPEELVNKYIFEPFGMKSASYVVDTSNFDRIVHPRDENGNVYDPYCFPGGACKQEGAYSAADDMVISVRDYARFLTEVMDGTGLSRELIADRNQVQVTKPAELQVVNCTMDVEQVCPDAQGFGLGWEILSYGDTAVLSHGGSDWSELTLGYFYTQSKDGIIVFLNGPNSSAVRAMYDTLQLMDPDSPMLGGYGRWVAYLDSEGN